MSFVNKFLDLTDSLPREIIRLLKLLKVAEDRSQALKITLQKKREQYLHSLKDKSFKKNITLRSLKQLNRELLSLSDYKIEVIKEVKYIIESSFLNKLPPIIEEGQNEVQEQMLSNSLNKIHIPNSLASKFSFDEDKSITEVNKNDMDQMYCTASKKFLCKKKNRGKSLKHRRTKEDLTCESTNKMPDNTRLDVYCKCKRESYGKMIQCDNPECGEWFHYECIGIKEGDEPEEWYCSEKCKKSREKLNPGMKMLKKMKKKIPKIK